MSRLDSFINRISAQRECLNHAVRVIDGTPGPVLELGLGNGRTYHHLLENCRDRDIYVFEWKVTAHADCTPDFDHLFEGDIFNTLPGAADRISAPPVLAHMDLVSNDVERDARIAEFLSIQLPALMGERAVILSDQPLNLPDWQIWDLPDGVPFDRYFYYARGFQTNHL